MCLTDFRCYPYSLPFRRPFRTARGSMATREGFVVLLQDEAGHWGVGEAAPLPEFGTETLDQARQVLAKCAQAIPGLKLPLPALGEITALPASWPGVSIPSLTPAEYVPTVMHALETALLDLVSQRENLPLARLLNSQAPLEVAVNATLGALPPGEAAAAAREAVSNGFATLKVKVGASGADADRTGLEADRRRLEAVRDAVGDAVRIRADANGAWTPAQASLILESWRDLNLEYIEQPVPPAALAAMARLRAAGHIPIAADESVTSEANAERVLAFRAADVLVLKPMVLGGLLPTYRVALRALSVGVRTVITSSLEGVFGRQAALHLSAAIAAAHHQAALLHTGLGAPAPACGLATGNLLRRDLLDTPPEPLSGRFLMTGKPGLGLHSLPEMIP